MRIDFRQVALNPGIRQCASLAAPLQLVDLLEACFSLRPCLFIISLADVRSQRAAIEAFVAASNAPCKNLDLTLSQLGGCLCEWL
jgi:hypothetical protein